MISANPESIIALSADPPDRVEVAGVDIPAGFANRLAYIAKAILGISLI
jgi:hypothetical protein